MATFLLKLSVAVIPLILLVTSVNLITVAVRWHSNQPLSWHRRRRHMLRALAHGTVLR